MLDEYCLNNQVKGAERYIHSFLWRRKRQPVFSVLTLFNGQHPLCFSAISRHTNGGAKKAVYNRLLREKELPLWCRGRSAPRQLSIQLIWGGDPF